MQQGHADPRSRLVAPGRLVLQLFPALALQNLFQVLRHKFDQRGLDGLVEDADFAQELLRDSRRADLAHDGLECEGLELGKVQELRELIDGLGRDWGWV